MISTAPIDWRRFSPRNASVFELQKIKKIKYIYKYIPLHSAEAWLARLHVIALPHMQKHKREEE